MLVSRCESWLCATDHAGSRSGDDRVGFDVSRDDGTGYHDGALSDSYPLEHDRVQADPDIVLDDDRRASDVADGIHLAGKDPNKLQVAMCRTQVMKRGVKHVRAVRDQHAIADRDLRARPDSGVLADEGVIPDADASAVGKREQFSGDDGMGANGNRIASPPVLAYPTSRLKSSGAM